MAKVKARIIMLESAENQTRETEKKCEQMAHRLREMEKKLESNRKEINHYQVKHVILRQDFFLLKMFCSPVETGSLYALNGTAFFHHKQRSACI